MDDILNQDIENDEMRETNMSSQMGNQGGSSVLAGNIFLYTVKKGDNLYALARRFQTTPQQIACMSQINMQRRLFIGQKLLIPYLFQNQQPPHGRPPMPPQPPMGPQPRNPYDLYF